MENNFQACQLQEPLCPGFLNEFRLLHAGTVNEFDDLIFLRHHVPLEEPTDLCVEEEIEPLGPYKRQKCLVLRVLVVY